MTLDLKGTKPPEPMTTPRANKAGRPPSAATQRKREAAVNERVARRTEGASGVLSMVAGGLMLAGQPADAAAFAEHGPRIAEAAAKTAEENAQVAKVLDYLSQAGPYGELLIATMPLIVTILANHNKIPPHVAAILGGKDSDEIQSEIDAQQRVADEQAKAADLERRRQESAVNLNKQEQAMREGAA